MKPLDKFLFDQQLDYAIIISSNSMQNNQDQSPMSRAQPTQQSSHSSPIQPEDKPTENNNFIEFGEVYVPQIIKISKNAYGYCLISTRDFKNGDFMYRNQVTVLPHDAGMYRFTVDGQEFTFGGNNSVKFEEGRYAYTWEGCMNHSCNENIKTVVNKNDILDYEIFAIKDIKAGDQIVCNYLQFDYLCDGHQFQCMCGSPKCYKHINGFKNISLKEQVGLLHTVYPQVAQYWLRDNPKIVLVEDLNMPSNIEIVGSQGERKIVAKREIKENEVIFEQRPMMLKQDSILVMKLGDKYEIVDLVSHSVNRGQHRQFLASACFVNHSCSPNSALMEKEGTAVLMCTRSIGAGEEITYDYSAFDIMSDAEEFPCCCHSVNCRKVIEGRKVHLLQELNQVHTY